MCSAAPFAPPVPHSEAALPATHLELRGVTVAVSQGIFELAVGVLRIGGHEVKSTALELLCALTDCLSHAEAAQELANAR